MCCPIQLNDTTLSQGRETLKARIFTFPVDPDGNLLTDGRFDYTWNAENRLVAIESTAGFLPAEKRQKLEFVYDHMGRRTIKKVYSWVGNDWQLDKTVTFVYDNYNEIARFEGGSLAKSYTWGEDLSGSLQGAGGVGGLLLVADGMNTYAPVYDASGNVTGYVDANSGAQVADYSYSPFGRTITKSGSKADDFDYKFSTKPQEKEIHPSSGGRGLYYYIFRYYDPEVGRWTNRDPIEEEGGENLYAFVGNNPVSRFDNRGESPAFSKNEITVISVNPPKAGLCGNFEWDVSFFLPEKAKKAGILIQKMDAKMEFYNCENQKLTDPYTDAGKVFPFWELWSVNEGYTFPTLDSLTGVTYESDDTWVVGNYGWSCTWGRIVLSGEIAFYPGLNQYDLPGIQIWNDDTTAGDEQYSTTVKPNLTVKGKWTHYRELQATWNCCEKDCKTTVKIRNGYNNKPYYMQVD